MKALEILKSVYYKEEGVDEWIIPSEMFSEGNKRIQEAIAELEALQAPKTCGECKWYIDFEGVCVNDESPLCADFVSEKYGCIHYEPKPIKGDKNV